MRGWDGLFFAIPDFAGFDAGVVEGVGIGGEGGVEEDVNFRAGFVGSEEDGDLFADGLVVEGFRAGIGDFESDAFGGGRGTTELEFFE